jgi:hypothetical protein
MIKKICDWWNFRNFVIGWDFLMIGDWTGEGTGLPGDPAIYRYGVIWIPLRSGKSWSLYEAEKEGRIRYFESEGKDD